jgi:hypothetical protein
MIMAVVLGSLPKEFNRKGYMEVAIKMGSNIKTAKKYLTDFKKTG